LNTMSDGNDVLVPLVNDNGLNTKFGTSKKRFIVNMAQKGGVGKTFVMRFLKAWLDGHFANPMLSCYDIEEEQNQMSFSVVYPDVIWLDAFSDTDKDMLYGRIVEGDSDIVLMDGRASMQERLLTSWMDETDMINSLIYEDVGVTIMLVLGNDPESVDDAHRLMSKYGSAVDFLIFLNEGMNSGWRLWNQNTVNGTKTVDLANQCGATVVRFPKFKLESIVEVYDEHRIPLSDWSHVFKAPKGAKGFKLTPPQQNRIRAFMAGVDRVFEASQDMIFPAEMLNWPRNHDHDWYKDILVTPKGNFNTTWAQGLELLKSKDDPSLQKKAS